MSKRHKIFAIMRIPSAIALVCVSSSALADEPLFPANTGNSLANIQEIYTAVSIIATGTDKRCQIVAQNPASQLDAFMAIYLTQFGIPKAEPAPVVLASQPYPTKPVFSLEGTTTLQRSSPFTPTCLLAMRAELSVGETGESWQVYWSSPIILLEVDAGGDSSQPSKDLQDRARTMGRALAEEFVKAWKTVNAGNQN